MFSGEHNENKSKNTHIYTHHFHKVMLIAQTFLMLSLAICPYHPSHLVGLPDCNECLLRADVCKLFLVNQNLYVHLSESRGEHQWWFVRWEAGCCTAAVLWDVVTRFCSKLLTAFLSNSHLAFTLCVLSAFMWCIHTVVWSQSQLERNPFRFYCKNQILIWSITHLLQSTSSLGLH